MRNYHTHTTYCDGYNTAEEMVQRAIELGFDELGFSAHSPLPFENDYAVKHDELCAYCDEINALKCKYVDKIKIYCGLELDYYGIDCGLKFDYIIGSVHHLIKNGVEMSVDLSKESQIKGVERLYDGDYYAFIDDYFDLVSKIYDKTKCNIIGHFDIIKKFNKDGDLFNESDKRYIRSARKAIDALKHKPCIYEVNTGAVSRGYGVGYYPSDYFLREIAKDKPLFVVNSDAHKMQNLSTDIENATKALEKAGYKTVKKLMEIL